MKTCTRCKETKPLSDFANNKAKKDGLQTNCRVCVKAMNAEYYKRSPEQTVNRLAYKDKSKEKCRAFVKAYLAESACVDCGNDDPLVLEFDHVRGEKVRSVSIWMSGGYSLQTLVKEIEKCEVRCANCHRRVTAQRGNWWRTL